MKYDGKIMITGTHGFVGMRAMEYYKDAIAVPGELVRNSGDKLINFVLEHKPEIILNTAAIADMGICEKNPDDSYLANVKLPIVLAKAAKEIDAKLVSFSSDQVYTGCTGVGPYDENIELPTPTSVYARHKLEAEQRALEIHPDTVMLRATWMYDMPMYNYVNRGNFLINTLKSLMNRDIMEYSSTYFRGVTYVRQVVELLDTVYTIPGGVYNYGSENPIDMYNTAKALICELGYEHLVYQLLKDNKAQRHNLWMDCEKIRKADIIFDTSVQGFKRCIEDYKILK